MLNSEQRYAIATMLATNSLSSTVSRICINARGDDEQQYAIRFAQQLDRFYKTRNGHIPAKAQQLLKAETIAEEARRFVNRQCR